MTTVPKKKKATKRKKAKKKSTSKKKSRYNRGETWYPPEADHDKLQGIVRVPQRTKESRSRFKRFGVKYYLPSYTINSLKRQTYTEKDLDTLPLHSLKKIKGIGVEALIEIRRIRNLAIEMRKRGIPKKEQAKIFAIWSGVVFDRWGGYVVNDVDWETGEDVADAESYSFATKDEALDYLLENLTQIVANGQGRTYAVRAAIQKVAEREEAPAPVEDDGSLKVTIRKPKLVQFVKYGAHHENRPVDNFVEYLLHEEFRRRKNMFESEQSRQIT